ncbi:MAG: hypothetical protein AB8B64_07180 [Granulosicoccus sp.]
MFFDNFNAPENSVGFNLVEDRQDGFNIYVQATGIVGQDSENSSTELQANSAEVVFFGTPEIISDGSGFEASKSVPINQREVTLVVSPDDVDDMYIWYLQLGGLL